VDQKMSTKI